MKGFSWRRGRPPAAEGTETRWSRVTEIVDGALRRPDPRERTRYLRAACGGDRGLRREVEELLGFEGAESGVLDGGLAFGEVSGEVSESAALPRKSPLTPLFQRGEPEGRPSASPSFEKGGGRGEDFRAQRGPLSGRVGPYRIDRPLGDGGMGVVALAWDPELERHVALKLVRRERVSEELLRRFETERRILARLDHPGIAKIFDSGTDGGVPYFAMEYVEGEPIDVYCDRRRLSVGERIVLVLEVCDALAEAHRNLVVHRDLKPGNVLVTADGEPKLLDFGIAKELDPLADASATRTGHQPLTPAYASPEQVRGRPVTVATDVYSLGVLLYRLLCGRPPYVLDGDHFENVRKICEEEPAAPSTQALLADEVWRDGSPSTVPPEVHARARSTDPGALARRLRGDLDSILARALAKDPKERYRSMEQLAEDLRRHLDGLPVTARRGTLVYRAGKFLRRHRRRLAAAALAAAALVAGSSAWLRGQSRVRAVEEARRRAADQAVEAELQAEALTRFARNLVRATDPDASGGRPLTAREILERGRAEARESLAEQPELLAHQLEALGLAHQSLGDLEAARPLLEESLELRRRLYGGDHRLVARGLNNLAVLCYEAGELDRAATLYRLSLAMKRRLGLPPEDLEKVEGNLATILSFRGAYEEAEALYRGLLERRRASYEPGDLDISTTLRNLGNLLYLKGDFGGAEDVLLEALELRQAVRGERSTAVASVLALLGRVRHAAGRLEEAEAALAEALAIRRELLGSGHLHVALTEKDLAELYFDLGEEAVAEVLWDRALAGIRERKAAESWELADAESRLGAWLAARGDFVAAEVCLSESYETLRRLRGEQALPTVQARKRLVELRSLAGGLNGRGPGTSRCAGTLGPAP